MIVGIASTVLFERLGVALAIGLLVGIERGWRERDAPAGRRAAGVRTFALMGLLGGVSAVISMASSPLFLALSAVAFALVLALFEWTEARANNSSSATALIAGLLTFTLGALSAFGEMAVAAACGVAATLLLAERTALHTFVERIRWTELRAALILLVMSVVLLPLLPDRAIDPLGALNPYQLWLMTISIAAISYAGYVFVRVLGEKRGLYIGAIAAALVSSTAVTLNYTRLAKGGGAPRHTVSAGILVAWAVSLIRMTVIAIVVAPVLMSALVPPVLVAGLLLVGLSLGLYLRDGENEAGGSAALAEPFDLGLVLRFGLLLVGVVFIYKFALGRFGDAGLVPLAAVSGIADVDPITLSVARAVNAGQPAADGASLILVAGTTNYVTRAVILLRTRNLKFAGPLIAAGSVALLAAWMVFGFVTT